MTRTEMEQYGDLGSQLEQKRKLLAALQIEHTEMLTDSVVGSYPDWPYTQHTITIVGARMKRAISPEEEKLLGEIDELMQIRDRVKQQLEFFFKELPGEHRTILDLTYIKGWSQRRVGDIVGYDHSTVSRILKQYE